jgi:ATP-binding protein involved in chromosome partitioning
MSESTHISEADVLAALSRVHLPGGGGDLVSRGLVQKVKICEGHVAFDLLLGNAGAELKKSFEEVCREAVSQIPGVVTVNVRFPAAAPAQAAPQTAAPTARPGGGAASGLVPGVHRIVAVGSGKGGVGKSTVAANLAVSLALDGYRVGLLDADVYGPSVPMMMGVQEMPRHEHGKLIPLESHGVKLMSLGFLMQGDQQYVIWRGPMVGSAVKQMLSDCEWGELDYLVVDLPPGTGDAQLTLAQSVPITGAVVVMTSQDVAVSIALKAVGMFQKLNVPVLGVVGNMDSFSCPCCGTQTPIFSRGGSEYAAAQIGLPFLGSIPLDPATVEHGDTGAPTVIADPDSAQAQAFRQVARNVVERVEEETAGESGDAFGGLLNQFGSA